MVETSPLPQRTSGRLSRRIERRRVNNKSRVEEDEEVANKKDGDPPEESSTSQSAENRTSNGETIMNSNENDESAERRKAEIEFVASAYSPEEAWCDTTTTTSTPLIQVCRRLSLPDSSSSSSKREEAVVTLVLTLSMPHRYPAAEAPLEISSFCLEKGPTHLWNAAFDAAPLLVEACRQIAAEMAGEEAVFAVLSRAEEWVQEQWPNYTYCSGDGGTPTNPSPHSTTSTTNNDNPLVVHSKTGASQQLVLGRRLIYSHHIISKIKRGNMKNLASHYQLTGYIKIGWPGIIIIEGLEEHCEAFYNDIKVWNWKFLVMRGEQQEKGNVGENSIDSLRRFDSFQEVSEMSLVANHCRQVGLESLFRTSMKLYGNNTSSEEDIHDREIITPYGALIWVDHMNEGKGYRKWLRKTGADTSVFLMIKQCFPNHDFTKKPTILVAVVGEMESVQDFMKRWRTSRVDVDSKGKACLERKMKVLHEGTMPNDVIDALDWDTANADSNLNLDREQLVDLMRAFGNAEWSSVTESVLGAGNQ